MSYLGGWKIDDLLTFTCNTHSPTTGNATDADSAPTYRVYEDETATPILTGTMATLDASNTDGFYSEQITLSAANGFEKGKSYTVRILAVVGGVTMALPKNFQMQIEMNPDPVWTRDMSAISGEAARSPLNAIRGLRNKWDIAAGTLTVKKENDSTTAWTGTVSQAAGDPITGVDPA